MIEEMYRKTLNSNMTLLIEFILYAIQFNISWLSGRGVSTLVMLQSGYWSVQLWKILFVSIEQQRPMERMRTSSTDGIHTLYKTHGPDRARACRQSCSERIHGISMEKTSATDVRTDGRSSYVTGLREIANRRLES